MKRTLSLALAASLSACVTPGAMPAAPSPVVTAALDRAEAAYLRWRPYLRALLLVLPDARAVQVRGWMDAAEAAFARARLASTAAEQIAQLRAAEVAVQPLADLTPAHAR